MINTQNGPVVSYDVWVAALASSACIGFTSLVPWLFNMTFFEHDKKTQASDDGRMKFLLSFAVGAILGDIFFHLIPESLQSYVVELNDTKSTAEKKIGLSVVAGIFMFIIVEMILEKWSHSTKEGEETEIDTPSAILEAQILNNKDLKQTVESLNDDNSRNILRNNNNDWSDFNLPDTNSNFINNNNNNNYTLEEDLNQHMKFRKRDNQEVKSKDQLTKDKSSLVANGSSNESSQLHPSDTITKPKECQNIDTAGYLSLIANGFDNFTHGLAIGASFLVGTKVGLLTTFVIIIHEIPHEICDYAILVNAGFSRWDAVKAQSSVSLFGILGTATALSVKSVQILNAKTVWILPFSAGGFLYIALVNLLPEILDQKTDLRNSLCQVACVILGIAFMASVAFI